MNDIAAIFCISLTDHKNKKASKNCWLKSTLNS
ncbi:hypothetical protein N474_00870 [Pseudoalteromonas luteoviolacea CPMOR-2]|uniref:Uncharacterized protein n=1 Tax=Pseudoalteromonas luteoviolacea DSM 6061 TaxID=1365250 RepID=A0A166YBA3_9GAMM|nr:hypothetical protein N475_10455 [Pseudoalteromonas luteoviolacea DSM 6061]KZN57075.1 hypothetical protein N474_00870 [Pseudoalteromonas luteoviolacea CPMOR-2]